METLGHLFNCMAKEHYRKLYHKNPGTLLIIFLTKSKLNADSYIECAREQSGEMPASSLKAA